MGKLLFLEQKKKSNHHLLSPNISWRFYTDNYREVLFTLKLQLNHLSRRVTSKYTQKSELVSEKPRLKAKSQGIEGHVPVTTAVGRSEGEESLCGMKSVPTGTHAKRWHCSPCADGCATIPWEMADPAFQIAAEAAAVSAKI